MKKYKIKKGIKIFLWSVLILSPIILLLVQSIVTEKNLFISQPIWSDELDYWREIYSFKNCGFNFGNYGYLGYEAEIGPFGGHGLSPLFAWGLWAILLPWKANSIVFANTIMMIVAYLIFVFNVRPDIRKTISIIIFTFTFPMYFKYFHTSMMEVPCYAFILVAYSLFYRYQRDSQEYIFIFIVVCIVWCSCIRICYAILLLPVILFKNRFKIDKKLLLKFLIYVLGFYLLNFVLSKFTAVYPYGFLAQIDKISFIEKVESLYFNFLNNIKKFFCINNENIIQIMTRYFYLLLTVFVLIISIYFAKIKEKNKAIEFLSYAIMMIVLFGMICLLYDVYNWRDSRILAPMTFGMVILLIVKSEVIQKIKLEIIIPAICIVIFIPIIFFSRFDFLDYNRFVKNEPEKEKYVQINNGILASSWSNINMYTVQSLNPQIGICNFVGEITESDLNKIDYLILNNEEYRNYKDNLTNFAFVSNFYDNTTKIFKKIK